MDKSISSNMYVCCGMSYEQSKSQSWFDILGNTTYRYTGHFGRGELAGTYDEKDCQVIHLIYPLKKSKPKIIYCSDEARRASPIVHQVQDRIQQHLEEYFVGFHLLWNQITVSHWFALHYIFHI